MVVGVGLLGAGLGGFYIDKTKDFIRSIKFAFVFAAAGTIMFSLVNLPNRFAILSISCCIIGFFGFAALPIALELSVETTFPVNEGVSAGLMWMSGQTFGIITLALVPTLRGEPRFYNGTTRVFNITLDADDQPPPGILEFYDYTNAGYMLMGIVCVAATALLFFNTEYKRLASERERRAGALEDAAANADGELTGLSDPIALRSITPV